LGAFVHDEINASAALGLSRMPPPRLLQVIRLLQNIAPRFLASVRRREYAATTVIVDLSD
jgi:hypothetical protein